MNKDLLEVVPHATKDDLIIKSRQSQSSEKSFVVCDKHLADKRLHLFIASNTWKELRIHLHQDIVPDYIKYIATKAKSISLVFLDEPNKNMLETLCLVFPEKAGKLRRYYLLKKDLEEAIKE